MVEENVTFPANSTNQVVFSIFPTKPQINNGSFENETLNGTDNTIPLDALTNYDLFFRFLNLYRIYPFVFFGIGTILNTLSLFVVLRPALRRTSTGVYLSVLAVTDNFVLLWNAVVLISNEYVPTLISTWFCKVIPFLYSWSTHVSVWILVGMTTDRMIAVAVPFKAHELCTPKKAAIAVTVIAIIFGGLNSLAFWTYGVTREHCNPDMVNYAEFWKYFIWIDLSFYSLLPGLLLLIFNAIIIYKLWHTSRTRRGMTTIGSNKAAKRGQTSQDAIQRQLTITLLLVTFAFIILTLPHGILLSLIYSASVFSYDPYNLEPYANGLFWLQVFGVLLISNHSFNFIFYCLGGRKFRQELCAMFACCRRMEHAGTFGTISTSTTSTSTGQLLTPNLTIRNSHVLHISPNTTPKSSLKSKKNNTEVTITSFTVTAEY